MPPDLITSLSFQANSPQQQLSIMTLATHLLLTVPPSNSHQSWDILRDIESHHNTLKLMLATITLQRYHQVWYTILDTRQHTATPLPTAHLLTFPVQQTLTATSDWPPVRPFLNLSCRPTKRRSKQ